MLLFYFQLLEAGKDLLSFLRCPHALWHHWSFIADFCHKFKITLIQFDG